MISPRLVEKQFEQHKVDNDLTMLICELAKHFTNTSMKIAIFSFDLCINTDMLLYMTITVFKVFKTHD